MSYDFLLVSLGSSGNLSPLLTAGHFNTIEVADQVNAMRDRFLAVGLGAKSFRYAARV